MAFALTERDLNEHYVNYSIAIQVLNHAKRSCKKWEEYTAKFLAEKTTATEACSKDKSFWLCRIVVILYKTSGVLLKIHLWLQKNFISYSQAEGIVVRQNTLKEKALKNEIAARTWQRKVCDVVQLKKKHTAMLKLKDASRRCENVRRLLLSHLPEDIRKSVSRNIGIQPSLMKLPPDMLKELLKENRSTHLIIDSQERLGIVLIARVKDTDEIFHQIFHELTTQYAEVSHNGKLTSEYVGSNCTWVMGDCDSIIKMENPYVSQPDSLIGPEGDTNQAAFTAFKRILKDGFLDAEDSNGKLRRYVLLGNGKTTLEEAERKDKYRDEATVDAH